MKTKYVLLSAFVGAAVGCGGGDDSGSHEHPVDGGYNCATDSRKETFTAGMQKTGTEGYVFTLQDSLPSPPAKGENTWTLQLMSPEAAPVSANIAVKLFMPDHNHMSPTPAVATESADVGTYQIAPVDLFMGGLFEITLTAKANANDTLDQVVFKFCVDG